MSGAGGEECNLPVANGLWKGEVNPRCGEIKIVHIDEMTDPCKLSRSVGDGCVTGVFDASSETVEDTVVLR